MTSLEDIVSAAMSAPPDRRERALQLLRGELAKSEPYQSLRGLSRALGFGVTTLRRWRVPGHQIGGAKRYRVTEVQEYLASEEFQRRVAAIRAERGRLLQVNSYRDSNPDPATSAPQPQLEFLHPPCRAGAGPRS